MCPAAVKDVDSQPDYEQPCRTQPSHIRIMDIDNSRPPGMQYVSESQLVLHYATCEDQ
jgi:hypothetical protein